ncbi:DUF6544 family protein [Thioalkalivibrio sp. XN279]|uniref:DUF6544 family protein n=1 Tax=Thioalkalivibrio sp. XN279 TaxID=2714953 RepID=UPI00140B2313|nr:DUF6544 family protein [Thioalkalivibrio sp. XN279]NHA14072.1 hypothetical protein [Thioalkalivibrio sp. XN279]
MPALSLLLLLPLLAFLGWLARGRRLRGERNQRIHDVLLQTNVGDECFVAETLGTLPFPAEKYLRHAVPPGAPLARSADVRMRGTLRVGPDDWVPFEARERISAERGFLWEARVAVLGRLVVEGADWLLADEAGIDYALADWWPALRRRGPELARSATGRMMVELAWLPAALTPQRGARWSRGDTDRAVVTVPGSTTPMTVLVSDDGRLLEASVLRRRLAPDGRSALAPYGIVVEAEARFGDFTVPSELVAAWGIGTDDRYDFMRVFVEDIDWL